MKKIISALLLCLCPLSLLAAPDKKPKVIDSYYLDSEGYVCDYDFATYQVKVLQHADSIKVHTYNIMTEKPAGIETYKVLNDSVQIKWGTQVIFDIFGQIRRMQFIDLARGTDEVVQYDDSARLEQRVLKDNINDIVQSSYYYKNGNIKNLSTREQTLDNVIVNNIKTWFPNGQINREQRMENGITVMLKLYDESGDQSFVLPCHDGDSVFYNANGNICTRNKAVKRGVIRLDNDSIKIHIYDNNGRKLAIENYMSYNPESPISWGVQQYFFANTVQPTDSVWLFRSVNGDNLQEKTFYEDGKLKSSQLIIYNNVMIPQREFRQYYPTGELRRVEKHNGTKLVEGHIYDVNGNEVFPFYEFKP